MLKNHLKKKIENGRKVTEIVDFNNKPIRHIRCRVKAGIGFLSQEKTLPIKEHIFKSKHKHKQEYLTQNEENYLYFLYEGFNNKNEIIRTYKILNLFEISQLHIKNIDSLKREPEFKSVTKNINKIIYEIKLKTILKAGDKVIFYNENKEELKELKHDKVNNRIYKILKFNELGANTAYVYLQHHKEARPDIELNKGEKRIDFEKYQPRLEFTSDKLNCAIENLDFFINPDGTIKWLF